MRIKSDFWTGADRICWLCVLMEEFIGVTSLASAPIVCSGMASIYNAPQIGIVRQAIFNLRQMSLACVTAQFIKHAVSLYDDRHYSQKTKGVYEIDLETLNSKRTDPLEHPSIAKARKFLQEPTPYRTHGMKVADSRQAMAVALGEESNAVRIPIAPIDVNLPERHNHSLDRIPNNIIRVPLSELQALARDMDDREAADPERRVGNWASRFDRVVLMVPEDGKGLREENFIEFFSTKQLIGLPGSGKTTMLVLTAMWLAQNIDYFKSKPDDLPKTTILLDNGYHPDKLTQALEVIYPEIMTKVQFELSAKPSKAEKSATGQSGFVPVAAKWVIERRTTGRFPPGLCATRQRSNAWVERCKSGCNRAEVSSACVAPSSLVKNFDRTLKRSNAKLKLCFIRLMLKRLAANAIA